MAEPGGEVAMYMRVVRGRIEPSKLDEVNQVTPGSGRCHQATAGVSDRDGWPDRATGRTIVISTWDTEEHATTLPDVGPGNPWMRATLVEAAWAATHATHTYLAAQYRRLAVRRGHKRAIIAVAHTMLIIAYRIIRNGGTYEDLGSNYFDERDRRATLRRSVQRLERLGYKVTVEAA
jgi:hypothetical protein